MVVGNVYASRQDTAHGFLDYLDESLLRLEAQLPQAQIIIQGGGVLVRQQVLLFLSTDRLCARTMKYLLELLCIQ